MLTKSSSSPAIWAKCTGLLITCGLALSAAADIDTSIIGTDQNAAFNADESISQFLSANRGTNGGGDQSLQGGDVLDGTDGNDLLVGAIGIDVLFGNAGDDILIGGTEDFNPLNRDRAFGGAGDDVFVWAPGDGNDFFDGGEGLDVVMFGFIGELRNADNVETGAPVFGVSPPGTSGSQSFDGIFTDAATGLPIVNVAGGPGFCEVVDGSANTAEQDELTALGLDHIVRFSLRGPAADLSNPDTGLRVAVHLTNTEFLVCGGETAGETVVLDLRTSPASLIDISELPAQSINIIQ